MSVTTTGAGSAGGFTPAAITGHQFTVTGGTLTGNDTDSVVSWAGLNAATVFSQATAARRGVVVVTSGKKGLRLDPTGPNDDGYVNDLGALTDGAQWVSVCCSVREIGAGAGARRVLNCATRTDLIHPGRLSKQSVFVGGDCCTASNITSLVSDTNAHTVIITKAAAGNWAVYLDGVSQPVVANANNWAEVLIGSGNSGESADADVWAVSAGNAQLTALQIADLHTYLRSFGP